jgi:hypothetical protein
VSGATTSSLPGNYAQVVDCPSVTQCTTAWVGETSSAQQEAKEMTFDPTTGTPNSAGTVGLGTPNVYLLACALSQCTIVVGDSHTTLLSFDPATGSRRAPVPVGGAGIADMTCPSASLCVMVTGGGQALAYDPGSGTHRIIGTVSGGGGGAAAAALGPALVPSGTAAKIGAILKAGAFPATVSPPGPGKAAVAWYYAPKGTHVASVKKPVVIASGTTTVKKAGSVKLKIRLTSAGRTMLKNAKSIALTSKGTFTPKGGKAVSTQKKFKLKR